MKKLVSCLLAVILTMTLALGQLMPAAAEEAAITVTDIQKYGNLVLSVTGTDLLASGLAYGDVVTVSLNGQEFDMPVGSNYSDVDQGSLVCRASTPSTMPSGWPTCSMQQARWPRRLA